MGEKRTGTTAIVPQTHSHRTDEKARWNGDSDNRYERITSICKETWAWRSLSASRSAAKSRVVGRQLCDSITGRSILSKSATRFRTRKSKSLHGTLKNTWPFHSRKRYAR